MMHCDAPIGVMDSGLGGLSVVLSLQKNLPWEDIIYYGDTANCPYGNKTRDELLSLSSNMLTFLEKRQVKCVALACNTTSALADTLRPNYKMPIITVAECAADAIGKLGLQSVGLVATVSTVNSGIYEKRIKAANPSVQICCEGSVHLARLVEQNDPSRQEIDQEICSCMDRLLKKGNPEHIILGCTHYPLVEDRFRSLYPNHTFMDPAPHQAASVKDFLTLHNALHAEHKPTLTVYTTGDPAGFADVCEKNGLSQHYTTTYIHIDN